MAIGVPLSLSLLGVTLAAVRWLVPRPAVAADVSGYVAAERRTLAPWAAGQWACATAFALAVTLWIAPGVIALFVGEARGRRWTNRWSRWRRRCCFSSGPWAMAGRSRGKMESGSTGARCSSSEAVSRWER